MIYRTQQIVGKAIIEHVDGYSDAGSYLRRSLRWHVESRLHRLHTEILTEASKAGRPDREG